MQAPAEASLARIAAQICSVLEARHPNQVLDRAAVEASPDLRALGLDSLATVNLMLAIELEFDLVIPPRMMRPQNFRSAGAILSLISECAIAA